MRKETNPDIRYEMSAFFEVKGKLYDLPLLLGPMINIDNEYDIKKWLRSNSEIFGESQITPVSEYLSDEPSIEQSNIRLNEDGCKYYVTHVKDAIDVIQPFSRWLFINLFIVRQFRCVYFICQELLALSTVQDNKVVSLVFRLLSAISQMEIAIDIQRNEESAFLFGTADYGNLIKLQNGFFQKFSKEYGVEFQHEYGFTSSNRRKIKASNSNTQMKKRDRKAPKQIPISKLNYWDNDAMLPLLKECLIFFACNNKAFDVSDYIIDWNLKGFAGHILSCLDEVINERLSSARPIVNSIEKKQIWVCDEWNTAIILWFYSDLVMGTEYRQCAMCGRLFPIGKQPNKKYCDLHDTSAIDYYNRKCRQKAEVALREGLFEEKNSYYNSIDVEPIKVENI